MYGKTLSPIDRWRPARVRATSDPGSPRLLCVAAHPDDESIAMGGTLARYAAEGVETYVLTATRGERGRYRDNSDRTGCIIREPSNCSVCSQGTTRRSFLPVSPSGSVGS